MSTRSGTISRSHIIILPSYNSGTQLLSTVNEAMNQWLPVWVVIDASSDGSEATLAEIALEPSALRIITLEENAGKGGAVLEALRLAQQEGYTHAMVMDADGQHHPGSILPFMALSKTYPDAMILGVPAFGPDAPLERVKGRCAGNWFANLETLWGGIHDSLFGLRVYPIAPALRIMESISTARRFDFDTELAVRLYWDGVKPINQSTPVHYPSSSEGGVSQFRYLRDNLLLFTTHVRLILGMFTRIPRLLTLRRRQ